MTAPDAQPSGTGAANKPLTAREKAKLNHMPLQDPLVGQVIGGHYEVLECIGKGGMSVVYKTRHQLINQFRAVKVLLPHRDGESDHLLRFQLEATAASRLDNKHIVRVHDFAAPEASAPYLVMDYAEGQALGDEIDRLGRLPVNRALAIFVQIIDAIGHTHARGVIHRDLKPDNILLVNDEVEGPDFVKLIDFGIAKLTAADKTQPQGLTPTGEIFGSPQYMSPEQCAGLTMDVRSEIYSLGCILYEMLTGRAPLLGQSVLETLNMQAHTPPIPLAKLSLEPPLKIPEGLDEMLLRCLAKKPEDRFQNTEDLRKAVTRLPSFDRRRQGHSKMFSRASNHTLGLAVAAVVISFALGFGLAKLIPGPNQQPGAGEVTANLPEAASGEWQNIYLAGQKAMDEGDLAAASSKLEAALTKANSLNDGQKRAAATGIDLCSLDLIKQFKNTAPDEVARPVQLSKNYPDNPWETRISAVVDLLRSPAKDAEAEQAIFKAVVSILEESHKGSLNSLNELLGLAGSKLIKCEGLNGRDKLRLALLISEVEEEQGYFERAANMLKSQASQIGSLGGADMLAGRFYLLSGRLALDQGNAEETKTLAKQAQSIFEESSAEHATELLEVALLRSDMKLAKRDFEESLKYAKQALGAMDVSPPSKRLDMLKDKCLLRAAQLDPSYNLQAAQRQCQVELPRQEAQVPKDVAHLITALNLSYSLDKLDSGQPANGRSRLWRATALALATGRLALASSLMQPLMVSYDTALTQRDLLKLACNRLAIDESLAAQGNVNGPSRLQDYVVLAETLEDFSLGPERDLKKARLYLQKATDMLRDEGNRNDHLTVARVFLTQARCAQERKGQSALVELLLSQADKELDRVNRKYPDKERDLAADALTKKLKDMEQDNKRSQSH